ncbi:MAG TPA: PAS domain S-box protein [Polyangiaceae bacterium]|jgi:PAS domain S-box-containing protein
MANRLRMLADAAREFAAASQDYRQLLDVVARRLSELGGDLCTIRSLSADAEWFELSGAAYHPNPELAAGVRQLLSQPQRVGEGTTGRAALTGQSILIPHVDSMEFVAASPAIYRSFLEKLRVTGVMVVPLKSRGEVIGVTSLFRSDPEHPFVDDDLKLLEAVAEHAALAIANARSYEAERAAQERYRMIFENNPQPMFVFDPQTLEFLELNDAAVRQYGYERAELSSMTLTDLWPTEDIARNRDAVARALPASNPLVVRHRKKDGTICDVEVRAHSLPFNAREGRLVLIKDVTEQLHADKGRKAAEARFARLADSGILGIVVANLDGKVLEINDALLELTGYEREEILSGAVRWMDLTPPEWRPEDQRAVQELAATGVARLREKQYIRKDGTRVPVLVGSALLEGTERECIAFVLDLRGSKRMANAIEHLREARTSEATFRSFVEAAPDAVVITNREGKIVLVNSQAERLFDYSRDALIGQSVELLVPERLRDQHESHRTRYFDSPRARSMGAGLELYGMRKDGTEFPIEISLGPVDTAEGLLVSSAIRDISERKKADEQRFRLAAIVEASDDAIIGKTLDGQITSWNDGAQQLFGYTADEIVGKSMTLLVPTARKSEEKSILARLARGESIQHLDTVRLRKDQSEVQVSVTSSPMRDPKGKVTGAAKIVRDISARLLAERELAHAKEAAEAANRELEAFSYSVAHDLRAPLRGMNAFAQLLCESYESKLDAKGQDFLQEILQNSKKMGLLIDALLNLARLSRGSLRPEPVDLSSLVRASLARLAAGEPERQVEQIVQDGLRSQMDPTLARALLDNLLGNAWKFTSKAELPRIEFGAQEKDGAPAFFVRDNGAGFDMAFANKLFGPFQRLHGADEFPGTGIGLATVQRIVNRHGGRVWAEGSVGSGAAFYFALPAHAPEGTS